MSVPEGWLAEPAQLAVGAAGKCGMLRLRASRLGARTRLTDLCCRPPLQVQRVHHLDPRLPDMAFVTIVSPAGGILQGDRLRIEVEVEPGARLHLNNQSMTRVYRMPENHAEIVAEFTVGSSSYLEYVPEAILPYPGARLITRMLCTVAEGGMAVLGEVIAPGPSGPGGGAAYEAILSCLEVRRPDGRLVCRDVNRLVPAAGLNRPGKLGRHSALGSLYVLAPGFTPDCLRRAVEPGVYAGASALPGGAGAWMKVLAATTEQVQDTITAAWDAARRHLIEASLPATRRY